MEVTQVVPSTVGNRRSEVASVELSEPSTLRDEGLALPVGEMRLRIGDLESEAAAKVPRDRGALEITDPVPVTGADLRTRGWANERRSFALTTHESRLVLALDYRRNVSSALLQSTLRKLEEDNGPSDEFLGGVYTNYRFWDRGRVRLMIVDTLDSVGGRSMTVALGDSTLMNALRMNLDDARRDQEQAARLLDRTMGR